METCHQRTLPWPVVSVASNGRHSTGRAAPFSNANAEDGLAPPQGPCWEGKSPHVRNDEKRSAQIAMHQASSSAFLHNQDPYRSCRQPVVFFYSGGPTIKFVPTRNTPVASELELGARGRVQILLHSYFGYRA